MTDRKRLHNFLSELLKIGCVKGFKYFATHVRGREEMVCSIVNEPTIPILLSATNSPASSFARQSKESGPALMSQKQQRRLSGYGFINVGLPPASPSQSEDDEDENSTMFLIASYARYNCPYVWVRSNHERLVRLSSEDGAEKDYPLMLKTTLQWQEGKDVKVWDIVAELIQICTTPCPPNPFAIDFDYFEALQWPERALASGAMAHFLQRILASGSHPYDKKVLSDLQRISQFHFRAMLHLLQDGYLKVPPPETEKKPRPSSSPLKRSSTGQMPPQLAHTQEYTAHTHPPLSTYPVGANPQPQPGQFYNPRTASGSYGY